MKLNGHLIAAPITDGHLIAAPMTIGWSQYQENKGNQIVVEFSIHGS